MKAGDRMKLLKKTFMQDGIFILTNSMVEIAEITPDGINAMYNDKEGFPHIVRNLHEEDLGPL
ncbi:MAG: hypothetical protein K8R21_08880 [Leptospira sp.]|nr:hypothetical protein [Leptospira sp.]